MGEKKHIYQYHLKICIEFIVFKVFLFLMIKKHYDSNILYLYIYNINFNYHVFCIIIKYKISLNL